MGLFDRLGSPKQATPQPAADDSALAETANRLVRRVLDVGIDGLGTFDSAGKVAQDAQRRRSDPERAIDDIVDHHVKLAAAGGFVTGLGGFVTLPVALPANVAGFYILAARMAAAVVSLRGYSTDTDETRAAILLALIGADADDVLKRFGYGTGGRLAHLASRRAPASVLMAVNKGVGFRLVTQLGNKTLSRLGRGVPFVGGAVGAGLDGYMMHRIGGHVRREFPPRDTLPALETR